MRVKVKLIKVIFFCKTVTSSVSCFSQTPTSRHISASVHVYHLIKSRCLEVVSGIRLLKDPVMFLSAEQTSLHHFLLSDLLKRSIFQLAVTPILFYKCRLRAVTLD